uniref:Integrase catalytic domain-containing protein n=1 Tax=Anopheles stephensi TaxID=30069 RepID=A0A182YRA6_ANOST
MANQKDLLRTEEKLTATSVHLQLIEIKSRNMTDIRNALSQYCRTFRPPRKIICDHEAAFTSIQFQEFLSNFGTVIEFASSSESNGQIEKTHSTIIELFNTNKHKFNDSPSSEIVQIVNSLYNDTVHTVTTFTPNEIIFNPGYTTNPAEMTENANKIFQEVTKRLQEAAKRMEKNNETKENPPVVNEGEDVYIKKNTRKN